jgi:hypothetical protein
VLLLLLFAFGLVVFFLLEEEADEHRLAMVTSVRLSSLVSPALAHEQSHSFAAAVFVSMGSAFTVAAAVAFEVVGGFQFFLGGEVVVLLPG